jgi:plastocyanin
MWSRYIIIASALLIVLISMGQTVSAETDDRDTTSHLLLPYFVVDLAVSPAGASPERTTFFTITNTSGKEIPTVLKVHSNWGIEVVKTKVNFGKFEQKAFDLYEWLALGQLPDRQLSRTELAQVQDKLTGKKVDGRLYASKTKEGKAVGYLTFEAPGRQRVFCGNYYLLKSSQKLEDGEMLIHFDHLGLCNRHAVFLLKNGVYDSSSMVVLWLKKKGHPSAQPIKLSKLTVFGYDKHGTRHRLTEVPIALISTQMIPLSKLGWREGILWLELESEDGTIVVVHYLDPESGRSAALRTCCFKPDGGGGDPCVNERPAINIEKSTNGHDADNPPGPGLAPGDTVTWKYVVTNTGNVTLANVKVVDDRLGSISCPKTKLQPDESMTCTEQGTAQPGQYRNVATASGHSPCRREVKATDPSHYHTDNECDEERPRIDIEKSTNGEDADNPTGPRIKVNDTVTWKYVVTNTGNVTLSDVKVSDDQLGPVSCPKTELGPRESMTCTERGTAKVGQYKNVATASGRSPCDRKVKDTDPSHYFGWDPCEEEQPEIDIEKSTNNIDADNPPGPELGEGDNVTWRYKVRNTGNVVLTNVTVVDDQLGPISCPKTELRPNRSMTCKQKGKAKSGQYKNVATASGTSPCKKVVQDTDPSHYNGLPAGKMTGGKSDVEGTEGRYTHGFILRCNGQNRGINLEINWGGSKFKLKDLQSVTCTDDPAIEPDPPAAPFDTIAGTGTGKLTIKAERGAPQRLDNAQITFKLTDAGEPGGGRDRAEYTISHPSLDSPIVVAGALVSGNHQAHAK